MKDLTKHDGPMALSYIAIATGALAIGAIAVGAIAIGRMVIGRLAIQRVRLHTVEVDNLTVRRLRVLETITPPAEIAGADHPASGETSAAPEQNGEARTRPAPRRRRPRKPMPH